MRKIYTLAGFITIMLVFTACKTASKLYNKGNYDEAVELAVKKIQKKPGDAKMTVLLQDAYRYVVNEHEARIRQLTNNTNELRWEWMYNEYASLQRLYNAVNRSSEAKAIVHPTDYSGYLNTYADKAADVRYQRGLIWMEKNDKMSFRNAYHEFDTALRFRPQDITLVEKKNEAYQYAVINVAVLPMNNYHYRYSSYTDNELRNFDYDLLRQLQYHGGNHFVKFYSSREASSLNIQPDQFIDFRFSTMNIGRVRDEHSTREVSKDVVIKETVYRPDSIVKEYKKVFAKITTTKSTMISNGNLQINIRDAEGRWLWSDDVYGDYNWCTEFASYTGDERALSDSDKDLFKSRQTYPPREEEIIRHILNEINNNLSNRIRNYYNRF